MKRNKFKRTPEYQQNSPIEDQMSDGELYDDALDKTSADYYARIAKNRIKVQAEDIWIALGLYLVLSSVAFVVLYQ
jgi:hypothetical protein